MKIGSKATYKTGLVGYVLTGIITAIDADGFVTFDAGSRGSFNLAGNDPNLTVEA
jgi:hypothetical protein